MVSQLTRSHSHQTMSGGILESLIMKTLMMEGSFILIASLLQIT